MTSKPVFKDTQMISNGKRPLNGDLPPKKSITESNFINIILAYSAIKNIAKGPPAYSTLYPETISDSPSVKSNGARFVSASVDTNHTTNKGKQGKSSQDPL